MLLLQVILLPTVNDLKAPSYVVYIYVACCAQLQLTVKLSDRAGSLF